MISVQYGEHLLQNGQLNPFDTQKKCKNSIGKMISVDIQIPFKQSHRQQYALSLLSSILNNRDALCIQLKML